MQFGFKKNMTQRERYAVYLAASAVFLFIVIQFIIYPYIGARETLNRRYLQKARDLEEIHQLKSEYEVLDKAASLSSIDFSKRDKGFTLFSFLDKLSGECGIKDHITYMKPTSSALKGQSYKISQVELKIKSINLKQLTDYLYGVETSRNVMFVKRISIDQSSKPEGYIDVVMQVETYEAND